MLNTHQSLVDHAFVSRVNRVRNEVSRRKQAANTPNADALVAHLWVRWLNVSVFGSKGGAA